MQEPTNLSINVFLLVGIVVAFTSFECGFHECTDLKQNEAKFVMKHTFQIYSNLNTVYSGEL